MSQSVPILYYDNRSPCNRSILMLIETLNISIDYIFVDLFKQEHQEEHFLKINQFHTVPCLKYNDLFLRDSHAILIFLCDLYGKGSLFEIETIQYRSLIIDRLMFHATKMFVRGKHI
uniref:glutathione transferase n=1 Tax=Culicoides sonorensis TaxID=179676 RepID=A0A336L543_CULSO